MDATIKGFDLEKDNLENILNEIFNIDLDDGVNFEFVNIKEIRQIRRNYQNIIDRRVFLKKEKIYGSQKKRKEKK